MPRATKQETIRAKDKTLVIDNGAYTIKAGFASEDPKVDDSKVIPNCIIRDSDRRVWVGSQLEQCKDFRELAFRRPVDKGYLVNWESEKAIWSHSFFSSSADLKCDPHETNLILTEAPNCPSTLQLNSDQVVFEELEFASYYRCLAPVANAYNDIASLLKDSEDESSAVTAAECLLLVDSGYSHTTITPIVNGRPIQQAIRRLAIGGKFLTNYLKEQLSIRSINLMDETYAVDEMKEAVSFVSNNFRGDLEKTWKGDKRNRRGLDPSVVVEYVLPDYEDVHKGIVRPYDPAAMKAASMIAGYRETVVTLTNERFSGPELFFNPSDVGLQEGGLPAVIMQSVDAIPESLRAPMLANVVLVGGNINLPGFTDRVRDELRQIAPSEAHVRVASPSDPVKYTWLGAARMASNRDVLKSLVVTKAEYEEHGGAWVSRKFASQGRVK